MTPTKFQVITFTNVEKTHTPQIRGLQVEVSLCPLKVETNFNGLINYTLLCNFRILNVYLSIWHRMPLTLPRKQLGKKHSFTYSFVLYKSLCTKNVTHTYVHCDVLAGTKSLLPYIFALWIAKIHEKYYFCLFLLSLFMR